MTKDKMNLCPFHFILEIAKPIIELMRRPKTTMDTVTMIEFAMNRMAGTRSTTPA